MLPYPFLSYFIFYVLFTGIYSFEEIMFVFTFYRNMIYAFCNNDAWVNKVNILVYGAWTALEFSGHW